MYERGMEEVPSDALVFVLQWVCLTSAVDTLHVRIKLCAS